MREIKFRAWDEKNNRYWYQFDISSLFGSAYFSGLRKDWIVEQFTGLKDKNGNEIYEGDWVIMRLNDHNLEFKPEVVKFENSAWRLGNDMILSYDIHDVKPEFEILGNIFEK